MMAVVSASGALTVISRTQLALALAIVKYKPPHQTIKEYILQIREYIKTGQRKQTESIPGFHLDSAAFWRDAYEKSDASQNRLLDKIYELEQRNESSTLMGVGCAEPKSSVAKRKAGTDAPATSLWPNKRAKTAQHPIPIGQKINSKPRTSVMGAPGPENVITSFLRRFYVLEKLLRRKSEPAQVATTCAELCMTLERLIQLPISEMCSTAKRPNKRPNILVQCPNLPDTLTVVERSFPVFLHTLTRITGKVQAKEMSGLVKYHLVHVFQSILLQLNQYALGRAKSILDCNAGSVKKGKQVSKTKITTTIMPIQMRLSPEDNRIMGSIAQCLITMIVSINTENREQVEVLEGLSFMLLQHVGKVLSSIVFRELQSNFDIKIRSSKIPLPKQLAQDVAGRVDSRVSYDAAVFQSRHLLLVFEQTISSLTSATLIANDAVSSEPNSTSNMKKRLQNTLLQGVFGDDDTQFRDSLKKPGQPKSSGALNELIDSVQGTDETGGDWFIQEVWKLLGWDALLSSQE